MATVRLELACLLVLLVAPGRAWPDSSESLFDESIFTQNNHQAYHELAVEEAWKLHNEGHLQLPFKSLHTRQTQSLAGIYDFCLDPNEEGFRLEFHSFPLREKCTEAGRFFKMPVPGSFNTITDEPSVRNFQGLIWYQKAFPPVARAHEDNHVHFIQFESVNYMAAVWVATPSSDTGQSGSPFSSVYLGQHVGGHLPFVFQAASRHFKGYFLLTVAVQTRLTKDTIPSGSFERIEPPGADPVEIFRPDFDFFHFGGILGQVSLIRAPKAFIGYVRRVVSPSRDTTPAPITYLACVYNFFGRQAALQLSAAIHSPEGLPLVRGRDLAELSYQSDAYECHTILFSAGTDKLKPWRPPEAGQRTFPILYRVVFTLRATNVSASAAPLAAEDRYETRLGVDAERLIDPQRGLVLPGVDGSPPRPLQGFGMHQETLAGGRSTDLASIVKDVYLLRASRANVVRTSHYPYASEFLEALDEFGVLVIGETAAVALRSFGAAKLRLHKLMLAEMVVRDEHHPSVVMWSLANEPIGHTGESFEYFAELVRFAHHTLQSFTLDAGRPVAAALAGPEPARDRIGALFDVLMLNFYYGWYETFGRLELIEPRLLEALQAWARKRPRQPIMVSEFGAESMGGLHSFADLGYSEEFQTRLILEYERLFDCVHQQANSTTRGPLNFWGSMAWNLADFSAPDSMTRIGGLNHKGLLARDRSPKMAFWALQRVYWERAHGLARPAKCRPLAGEHELTTGQARRAAERAPRHGDTEAHRQLALFYSGGRLAKEGPVE